ALFASMVPGGNVRISRPTLDTPPLATGLTTFASGWTRKASSQPEKVGSHAPPEGPILHTRPCPVVPSPVHRLPSRSNASPLVPGTPVAKGTVGFMLAAVSCQTTPP